MQNRSDDSQSQAHDAQHWSRRQIMSSDLLTQIEYYNKMWSDQGYANRWQLERCAAILEELRSFKLDYPEICDLGCGSGWLTAILAAFGPTVGVELSDVAVERAAKLYPSVSFVCSDILQWRNNESFDVVVSQEVIEHFEDQARFLSIAHDILRPRGHIILTTPNVRTAMAAPAKYRSNQPIENWLTRRSLYTLMSRFFSDVNIRTIVFGYGNAGLHRMVNSVRLGRVLSLLGLAKTWRNLALSYDYGLHFIATGTKKA